MSTEEEDQALKEIGEALNTSIGSQEIVVTQKLGKSGYEDWKRRSDQLEESAVRSAIWKATFDRHNADLQQQSARYVGAKAAFWAAMTVAILVGSLCGLLVVVYWLTGA